MLEQLSRHEAPRCEAGYFEVARRERTAVIGSVVEEFLRNDAGFSDEDVADFINAALQNEARDLWRGQVEDAMTIDMWQNHIARATGGFQDVDPVEAERRLAVLMREISTQYNADRAAFGEAALMALRSERVALASETCVWVIELDHDGHLTHSTGVDVRLMFGSNQEQRSPAEETDTDEPRTADSAAA